MADKHLAHALADQAAWLAAMAVYLAGCKRGLTVSGPACQALATTLQRAADVALARVAADQEPGDGDLIDFAASGGPPAAPARSAAVPMPELGPNVVFLAASRYRPAGQDGGDAA